MRAGRRRPAARRPKSKVRIDDKKCPTTGKHRYKDERSARLMLNKIRRSAEPDRQLPVRVYQCTGKRGCGDWHLTSKPERRDDGDQ